MRGIDELNSPAPKLNSGNRIRRKGGGRKPSIEMIENIDEMFLKLIENTTTKTGLRVKANIVKKVYQTGREYSDNFKETMKIVKE